MMMVIMISSNDDNDDDDTWGQRLGWRRSRASHWVSGQVGGCGEQVL